MREPLSLSDVVPVLRADLKIGEPLPGRGESEIKVEHPVTSKVLMLKGFEVSIARMLNGRRTAEEVLSAAGQIGLPLSIESFNGFLHKLHKEGFLTELPARPPEEDIRSWEPRAEWSDEIRRLFQEALREARGERFVAAKSRLDTLLARAPATREAQQLLHWVLQRLHPSAADKSPSFFDLFAQVEKTWFAEGDLASQANERAAMEMPTEHQETLPPVRSRKGLAIGAAGVVALTVALVAPLPRTVTAPITLTPKAVTPVTIARAGTVLTIPVSEGQWVEKGTTLAQWDTALAAKKVAALEARLAEAMRKQKSQMVSPKKLNEAKARVEHATAMLKRDQAEFEKLKAKLKGKRTVAVAKAEKKVVGEIAAQLAAQQALTALTDPPTGNVAAEISVITGELELARAQSLEAPLVASADGFVLELAGKPGQPLAAGTTFARLEDSHTLKVVVEMPKGEKLEPGAALQLKIGGVPARVIVEKIEGRAVEAALENPNGSFKAGTAGESSFAGAPRSLLGRL
jgi:multidrug efflux pump subunit AcrA (membrane-fusion protein)